MASGTSDPAHGAAPVAGDACPHTSVSPGGVSQAFLSFPVLSGELEFGYCRDCHSPMLRELGDADWQPMPRQEPST